MKASSTVRQVLNDKGGSVWTISPDASVFEGLQMMADRNVCALVVVDGGQPVGMLSERDYARKIILVGKASRDTAVREIMSSPVVSVSPRQSVGGCMKLMTEKRLRHLPVIEDGQMIGLVSIGDIVKAIMSEQEFMIEQLETYISNSYHGPATELPPAAAAQRPADRMRCSEFA